MKARQTILAVLLTVTSGVSLASSQHLPNADRKMGTLIVVVEASDDEQGPFHVVILKSGTIKKEFNAIIEKAFTTRKTALCFGRLGGFSYQLEG